MAVGDSLGHPFEFLPVQDRPLGPHFDFERFEFVGASNTFRLKPGQWTDDAAMGLCMADSLLMRREFDGSDMRIRFWCWWNRGYNNAFRKELLSVERKGASMARKIACDSLQRAAESTQLQ
ncbi:tri1 [Symbiodinium sp. KB8]|nr:tri1 [Symbiodinium sp. KB8]